MPLKQSYNQGKLLGQLQNSLSLDHSHELRDVVQDLNHPSIYLHAENTQTES